MSPNAIINIYEDTDTEKFRVLLKSFKWLDHRMESHAIRMHPILTSIKMISLIYCAA
jgi:hypothetical protein